MYRKVHTLKCTTKTLSQSEPTHISTIWVKKNSFTSIPETLMTHTTILPPP